ncbi:MAG: L,D-transpeptidase family protein [Kiritimatiellae bacterium]|nr:L,D-transpeptidase family protein [Kiritimatiellia bacterium]
MMETGDIFVHRGGMPPRRNRGARVFGLILLILAVVAVIVIVRRDRGPAAEPATPEPSEAAAEVAAALPEPAPESPPAPPTPPAPPAAPAPSAPVPSSPAPESPAAAPAPAPTAPTDPSTSTPPAAIVAWAEASEAIARGEWGLAREKAMAALDTNPPAALRRQIEDALNDIHTRLVFTPAPMPEKTDYVIEPGDTLGGIARKLGTTVEMVMKGNQLSQAHIRPGDRLRVLTGKFRAVVSVRDRDMTVFLNDRFFKRYRVGTGKYEKTPTGDFQITDRIAHPTWWRPDGKAIPYGDPENVLGTHWLALNVRGYGLHGTWEPETIGQAESAGCVRLLNTDIEELFSLLPIGTPVSIQP